LVNRNESEGANLYLSGFAKLLRHTLYHSDQDYLRLEDELLHLRHYCELEALRSPFEYEIRVEEDIDTFNTEIPGMLLQPFVENAIVHGLRNHPGQPHLDVWIYRQGLNLVCVISDNGMGIAASLAQRKNKFNVAPKKHGMSISLERIRLLNLRLGKKITLEVQDLGEMSQQSGTRIIITIPMAD
jgi:LytS/YehU family sensor histidine kinase